MRTNFKLIARFLIDVRAAIDRESSIQVGKRDRTTHLRARALGRADDLADD